LQRAAQLQPADTGTWVNLCAALRSLRRLDEALASADRALQLNPQLPEALANRGNVLMDLDRTEEALASYERALSLRPRYAEALNGKGSALRALKRHDEAARCYAALLEAAAGHPYALGYLQYSRLNACDWTDYESTALAIESQAAAGAAVCVPFALLPISTSSQAQLACAQTYVRQTVTSPAPLWTGERYRHDRIRVAYLSSDFREHAVGYLMAELFELHDSQRFELTGVSFGSDDGSATHRRLAGAFKEFVDVRGLSDKDVAAVLRQKEIDIAVDLNGFTQNGRPGILACRPAPVQVNYLGYPGTMGAAWIDYIVADAWVIPPGDDRFYSEKVVRLPGSYQVNDRRRTVGARAPSRAQAGLPPDGFVFCCFNNNFKIDPPVFQIWMRLLAAVPGSVLWLLADNAAATRNLQAHAARQGVDPTRLVFAPRQSQGEHLARHCLADLFLDTAPYGAHTGASDALWTGLPVVTCVGATFSSRVAASLLNAAGLPELVTQSWADYESLALDLARTPERLAGVHKELSQLRGTCALFDTARFCRALEAAFSRMHQRSENGLAPESFSLEALA
jgi:protein O-GlcNAc transferase